MREYLQVATEVAQAALLTWVLFLMLQAAALELVLQGF